jgi:hypothetical protein
MQTPMKNAIDHRRGRWCDTPSFSQECWQVDLWYVRVTILHCIYNYINIDTTYVVYDSVFDSLPYYMIWNIYIYVIYSVYIYIYTDIDFHGETTIWLGLSRRPTRWINALLAPSAIMTKVTGQHSLQYKTYQWNMNKTHTTDSRRNLSGQQKQNNIYPLVI